MQRYLVQWKRAGKKNWAYGFHKAGRINKKTCDEDQVLAVVRSVLEDEKLNWIYIEREEERPKDDES